MLLRRVAWWLDTNLSEDHIASVFSVLNPEDGGSKVLRKVGIQPPRYTA
jgi:hypothetical protein